MLNRDLGFWPRPCRVTPQGITILHQGSGTAVQAAVWGSLRLNRSPLVRTLLACAAICVAVPLSGCNTDGVLPMSEKAARPLPAKARRGDRVQEHGQGISDPDPRVQGRVRARGLEAGSHRTLRAAEDLSDLPLVGRTRPEDQGRRPSGAGGLLHHHPRPDESELGVLPVVRSRLSERLSTARTAAPARSSWCTATARRAAATR